MWSESCQCDFKMLFHRADSSEAYALRSIFLLFIQNSNVVAAAPVVILQPWSKLENGSCVCVQTAGERLEEPKKLLTSEF